MSALGSAPAVIAAVRDEAAADIERLEAEATAALDILRATLAVVDEPADAAVRLAAARKVAAEAEADDDWQDAVTAATDRDAWITAIVQEGRRALAAAADAPSWTAALAREAAAALPGDACVLVLPAPLAGSVGDAWRVALERSTGKRITIETGPLAAGCIARTPDGRIAFDNSLDARERRTHTAWRGALARLYDRATSASPAVEPEHAVETA